MKKTPEATWTRVAKADDLRCYADIKCEKPVALRHRFMVNPSDGLVSELVFCETHAKEWGFVGDSAERPPVILEALGRSGNESFALSTVYGSHLEHTWPHISEIEVRKQLTSLGYVSHEIESLIANARAARKGVDKS